MKSAEKDAEMQKFISGETQLMVATTVYPDSDFMLNTLEQRLMQRWQALEKEDRKNFYQTEGEIAVLLKQVPPNFERLDENANRLFIEGDQRLRVLEAELQNRSSSLKKIETGLIALVVIIGGIAGILFMRRLTAALSEARIARDETEGQRVQNATMLDTLSDGVYATDLAGNITFINTAAERILGWRSQELVGQ